MSYQHNDRDGRRPHPYPPDLRGGGRGGGGGGYGGPGGRGHGGGGWQGANGGRGGGGSGGRGGGRGGGGGRGPPRDLPGEFDIQVNQFEIEFHGKPGDVWHMYKMIVHQKRIIRYGDREKITPETAERSHEDKQKRLQTIISKGATEFSRNIFQTLAKDLLEKEGSYFASDCSELGVAPEMLWSSGEPEKSYFVNIAGRPYEITLQYVTEVKLDAFFYEPTSEEEVQNALRVRQCLDFMIKSLGRTCLAFGKNPDTYYLREDKQRQLLAGLRDLQNYYGRNSSFGPYVGISLSARFSRQGKFMLEANNKIEWMHFDSNSNDSAPIPLLDRTNQTIAGIRIHNINIKIQDEQLQKTIEEALRKVRFTCSYTKGTGWEDWRRNLMRAKGEKEEKIEAYLRKFKLHTSDKAKPLFMCPRKKKTPKAPDNEDTEDTVRIKWSAHDESFQMRGEDRTVTVAEYFQIAYDIVLEYPNMPLICTQVGWLPIEFLFQASSRVSGNDEKRVTEVLKYHDQFAGMQRMEHLTNLIDLAFKEGGPSSFEKTSGAFGVSVRSSVPWVCPAQRLPAPQLQFQNHIEVLEQSGQGRGAYNLVHRLGGRTINNRMFRAAELPSYAVIDFCSTSKPSAQDTMLDFFAAMERHGMTIPNNGRSKLNDLIISAPPHLDLDSLRDCFLDAVAKAKRVFLRSYFFFGCVQCPDGSLENTWMVRVSDGSKWHVIPADRTQNSHLIRNAQDPSRSVSARMQFQRQDGSWIDPSDWVDPSDDERNRHGGFEPRDFGFRTQGWDAIITCDEIADIKPIVDVEDPERQIECPSMIFCYLPDTGTRLYENVKTICDFYPGVNSQCIVQAKVRSQTRGTEQYFSNIALKVNSKLFNNGNKACAFTLANSVQWAKNKTMIFGYSFSHAKLNNHEELTAVAGSVCLEHPMQTSEKFCVQVLSERKASVEGAVLEELVSQLVYDFWVHLKELPERIIAYRDAGSPGSFDAIEREEVPAIRNAIGKIYDRAGLQNFKPTITFVVANKDHNARIVPVNPRHGIGKDDRYSNVPSGTLVDNLVEDFRLASLDSTGKGSFSFLLTPQGPMKGTSKPMVYHCLLNENQDTLGPDIIKKMTYELSFQYGSATKSPRKLPVFLFSEKIGKRVMSALRINKLVIQGQITFKHDASEAGVTFMRRSDFLGQQQAGQFYQAIANYDVRVTEGMTGALPNPGHKVPFRPHITG